MKKLKTSRPFYKKWVYKIHCYMANGVKREWANPQWRAAATQKITEFKELLSTFTSRDLQMRKEGDFCSIFCNDPHLANELIDVLKEFIVTIHEPGSEKERQFLLDYNCRKIACDKIPWGKYQHKIFFKYKMKLENKLNFLSWTERYNTDTLWVSGSTKKWLEGKVYWIQNPFMYVNNSSTLSMVCLYLGDNLKLIEEFVPRSSINS
jgi:hypothetical protein